MILSNLKWLFKPKYESNVQTYLGSGKFERCYSLEKAIKWCNKHMVGYPYAYVTNLETKEKTWIKKDTSRIAVDFGLYHVVLTREEFKEKYGILPEEGICVVSMSMRNFDGYNIKNEGGITCEDKR